MEFFLMEFYLIMRNLLGEVGFKENLHGRKVDSKCISEDFSYIFF